MAASRVLLSSLTQADMGVLFEWINDRGQVILNAPYRPVHETAHREWFESVQRARDSFIFGIRLRETNRLIGSCQLHSISQIHRCAELQIRLGKPEDRGQGYGTEATRLLLDFAFRDLNLHRVQLHVRADNRAAIRVYEKVGFVREGLLKEAAHMDGCYIDLALMAVLRGNYVA